MDEQTLIRCCSQKDRQAQEELYMRYAARTFTLCRRYTDNLDEAQDLLHDAFLKVLEHISTFEYKGNGSLQAWITKIAINTAVSNISRHRFRFISLDTMTAESIPEPSEEEVASVSMDTLIEFISKLPDTQRAVFNLFCVDDYSHREIAELLGISEKGSASLLAKAKRSLREQIRKHLTDSQDQENKFPS